MLLAFALGRTLRGLGRLLRTRLLFRTWLLFRTGLLFGTRLMLRTWRTRLLIGPPLAAFSALLSVAPLFEPALLLAIAMLVAPAIAPAITSFAALLLGSLVSARLAVAAVLVARRALWGRLRLGLGKHWRGRRRCLGLEQAEDA
jgi:hypothetical protein